MKETLEYHLIIIFALAIVGSLIVFVFGGSQIFRIRAESRLQIGYS